MEEEIFENQRYYGDVGFSDVLLPSDRYDWSDRTGAIHGGFAYSMDISSEDSSWIDLEWILDKSEEVDEEGWRYAYHFKELFVSREGGRSAKRSTDLVRSRRYTRRRKRKKEGVYTENKKLEVSNLYDSRINMRTKHLVLQLKELGLKVLKVPVDIPTEAKCPIFVSSSLESCDKLILFIQGSGGPRPGMWSRSLCLEKGLRIGTMINYIEQARSDGYGIIISNPFANAVNMGGKPVPVSQNESPISHIQYIWKQYIATSTARSVFIVSQGPGCDITVNALCNIIPFEKRISGIAFLESNYQMKTSIPMTMELLLKHRCIDWRMSYTHSAGSVIHSLGSGGCTILSGGVMQKKVGLVEESIYHMHMKIPALVQDAVFRWFSYVDSLPLSNKIDVMQWAIANASKNSVMSVASPRRKCHGEETTAKRVNTSSSLTTNKFSLIAFAGDGDGSSDEVAEVINDDEGEEFDANSYVSVNSPLSEALMRSSIFSDDDEESKTIPSPSRTLEVSFPEVPDPSRFRGESPSSIRSPSGSPIPRVSPNPRSSPIGFGRTASPVPFASAEEVLKSPRHVPMLAPFAVSNSRTVSARLNLPVSTLPRSSATPDPQALWKSKHLSLERTRSGSRASFSVSTTKPESPIVDDPTNDLPIDCPDFLLNQCELSRRDCPFTHGPVDTPYPDLILMESGGNHGVPLIDAGTIDRLIEALIAPEYNNYEFKSEFLLCFPQFCTVEHFVTWLVNKFASIATVKQRVPYITLSSDKHHTASETPSDSSPSELPKPLISCISMPTSPLSGQSGGKSEKQKVLEAVLSFDDPEVESSVYRLLIKNSALFSSKGNVSIGTRKTNIEGLLLINDESYCIELDEIANNSTKILLKGLGLIKFWLRQSYCVEDFKSSKALDTLLDFFVGTKFTTPTVQLIASSLCQVLVNIKSGNYTWSESEDKGIPGENNIISPFQLKRKGLEMSVYKSSLINVIKRDHVQLGEFENLMVFTPQVIAEQLSLIDEMQFKDIDERHLVNFLSTEGKSISSSVQAVVNSFNSRIRWLIAEMIHGSGDAHNRSKRLVFCIDLAEACVKLNNFNSLFIVISALDHPCISKLKTAWSRVPDGSRRTLEYLQSVIKASDNYTQYRKEILKCRGRATVPAINVFLKDLTATEEANPSSHIVYANLINFKKWRKIHEVIFQFKAFQEQSYLSSVSFNEKLQLMIQERISSQSHMSEKDLWSQSKEAEREDSEVITNNLKELGFY